jgi:hypothetical protein
MCALPDSHVSITDVPSASFSRLRFRKLVKLQQMLGNGGSDKLRAVPSGNIAEHQGHLRRDPQIVAAHIFFDSLLCVLHQQEDNPIPDVGQGPMYIAFAIIVPQENAARRLKLSPCFKVRCEREFLTCKTTLYWRNF